MSTHQRKNGGVKTRRAYIEISNMCQLKCSFCPGSTRPPERMDYQLFAHIACQLPALGIHEVFLHLMGEPLGHPQLRQILDICQQHALTVNLVTNGLLLQAERVSLALHPSIRQINFSLHALSAQSEHEDLCRQITPIMDYVRSAQTQRPELYINFRLWDLEDPLSMNKTSASIRQVLAEFFKIDLDAVRIDARRKNQIRLAPRVHLHMDTRFVWPELYLPIRSQQGFCYAFETHFGILADGRVVPCCLDKDAVIALGNCKEHPLETLLTGERAQRMQAGFAAGELVEALCQRCQFIKRFDSKVRCQKKRN